MDTVPGADARGHNAAVHEEIPVRIHLSAAVTAAGAPRPAATARRPVMAAALRRAEDLRLQRAGFRQRAGFPRHPARHQVSRMIAQLCAWWRQRQADRLEIRPALWDEVEAGLPFIGHLTPDERARLRQLARELIAEKQWSGAQGLQVTPHIQLAIALQACLPILHLGLDWYAGWVGIVVYPGDFVIPRRIMDEDGVMHEFDDDVMGEAWYGGPVLISWFEDPQDAAGINVVIHEFAHKLDMKSGEADGMPPMHAGMSRQRWIEVMSHAFDDFQRRVDGGEETLLDPYAAELPTEFFAVASEAFFETPELLKGEYPDVYEQFKLFYRQDPAVSY